MPAKIRSALAALAIAAAALGAALPAQASTFTVGGSGNTFIVTRDDTTAAETVNYRTVSLSAYAGQHYTAKSGTLTFAAGQTAVTNFVTEKTPTIDAYKFQTTTQRSYRFELTDEGGFPITNAVRSITTGTQLSTTYLNREVTDLVYFTSGGSITSGSGNKYLDVTYGPSSYRQVTDGGYNQAVHTVGTGSLYGNNAELRTFLDGIGCKMDAFSIEETVYVSVALKMTKSAREKEDANRPRHFFAVVNALDANGELVEVECNENDPLTAFVFKTVADPFVGKMSFMKVFSGSIAPNKSVVNATTGSTEKVGKLVTLLGKKQTDVAQAGCGDIVVALKMNINTNDTICDAARVVKFPAMEFPKPSYKMAVKAASQGDESKISNAISRILEEDKTVTYEQDPDTLEQIISTLGGVHLDSIICKLGNSFGVDVNISVPKIAYRETIRKKVKVQGRHKKQSGGHGQYGDVWIEFEPCVSDELIFEEKVFGGAVPKNFFPAVEKGLQESIKKGVLAGFPVVGLKAILVDGSYHPVDSSEMAFKMAASIAYKEGMRLADPVLLEPIGALNVLVPDDNTGDIMGELNKRRGRVLGMNPSEKAGLTEVVAEVPMAEMSDFTMYLRQTTQGRGSYTFEKVRYEQLPANLFADVIAKNAMSD